MRLQSVTEVWHSRPTKVDYRVATFWYGDADNTSNAQADETWSEKDGRDKE